MELKLPLMIVNYEDSVIICAKRIHVFLFLSIEKFLFVIQTTETSATLKTFFFFFAKVH